eukprot:TRINITY_DN23282_c0_g1_i1.p1 TRINITY_DN23282_c0_g1~~TRINITY_DN23282_c0_g1_i1.p1  ORF type:complete len:453 (+),score=167.39 TRINITY_DN23282_c0_g1_i1:157-1515(+)
MEQRKPLFPILSSRPQPAPLFPVVPLSDNGQQASSSDLSWLSNPSFKVDSSFTQSIVDIGPPQAVYPPEVLLGLAAPLEMDEPDDSDDDSDSEPDAGAPALKRTRPIEISSDSDSDHDKHRRKKSKKHKKERDGKRSKKEKSRKKTDKEKILDIERRLIKDDANRKALNIWLDSTKGDRIYEVDFKGDQENLLYGALYRLNVPIYYRRRRCMGLGRDEGITFDKAGYTIFRLGDRSRADKVVRYTSRKHMAKEFDPEYKRLHLDRPAEVSVSIRFDDQPAFVPLITKKPRPLDDDEEAVEEGESHEQYLQRRAGELNQFTREHPHDIDAWLEFVRFQDDYVQLGRRAQVNKAALIEKKIAIFERALASNPDSEILKLGLLKEARDLWDQDKMQAAWRKTLAQHAANPLVWQEGSGGRASSTSSRASTRTTSTPGSSSFASRTTTCSSVVEHK